MSQRAYIVVDLGFGDAGKGLVTDYLVRDTGARTVVRFNGGAQAGHNVVTPDGRHHTFAQLGAGSFVPGVRTHLSRFVVVHPTALAIEARHLARAGVADALSRVTVSGDALVVTPLQQAACRLREQARGDARHGSCGVGVGEVMQDALEGHAVRVAELSSPGSLRQVLARMRERKREELRDVLRALEGDARADEERRALLDDEVIDAWVAEVGAIAPRVAVVDDERAMTASLREGPVVFEGAQGVLLDEWRGFHPHTTWSTCTPHNALELLGGRDVEARRVGVIRTYATRHGAGPFPTEDAALRGVLHDPHNVVGPWQGAMRFGWLDFVLLRYALEASGGVDALAVTHLDALPRLGGWRFASAYRTSHARLEDAGLEDAGLEGAGLEDEGRRIRLGPLHDLDHQARLTQALFEAEPIIDERDSSGSDVVLETIEAELRVPVALASAGPRSSDVVRVKDR